ncbi:hypothetical protein K2173_015823 [Erythroxylum novogranatense]|uniref:HMA domain-containing protein n=1 Tax=Erythroxylum novogranatense TaxID=1862640 RepID=A0AAV8SEJ4_9ROSI|nr:hypothetical protein K2173_015823 [Erythroxylum novogranatense]
MKGMDLFCASPASTAICSSLDQRSMVRRATRPIDRHSSRPYAPCASHELPIDPGLFYEKFRKSSSAKQNDYLHGKSSAGSRDGNNHAKQSELRRKSSADISDVYSSSSSSRYLLSDHDSPYIDWISESDKVSALVPSHAIPKHRSSSHCGSPAWRSSPLARSRDWRSGSGRVSELVPAKAAKSNRVISSDSPVLRSSSSARSHDQVVVLRVSIHCKGCEGKVRKHISKMEGVTSFSIDLATKKVTVIGNVTPLGVLASVSKVKSAQLWPSASPTSSSPLPTPCFST